jgi:sn-glycerol 3-phosphate transport system substrate-binding protein
MTKKLKARLAPTPLEMASPGLKKGLLAAVLTAGIASAALLAGSAAQAAENIKFYFPTSVQGRLAQHMKEVVKEFNASQDDVKVTAVYTGSYQETMVKSAAAFEAGNPPAVALMGANNILDFVQKNRLEPIKTFLAAKGMTTAQFLSDFWPGVHANATINGELYAVPFQNSTPILYYNTDHFKAAGLDPAKPPKNWKELISMGQKLVKKKDGKTTRYALMMPMEYGYGNWIFQAFVMSNGGQYFNPEYPGEVYYDSPTTRGALQFYSDMAKKYGIIPASVTPAKQVAADFFAGNTSMMIASTGGLTNVRKNARFGYNVAFVPGNVRNAVPVGGASMVIFKGLTPERRAAAWKFVSWITSAKQLGAWSRFSGYFAPRKSSYDLPEMKAFLAKHPDAGVAVKQLKYTKPWYSTYNVLAVARPMGDAFQSVVSGKAGVREALKRAQSKADRLLAPFNNARGYPVK